MSDRASPILDATTVVRPGDSWERPTERYAYLLGAPLSRVTTDARVWSGRDDVEHSEVIYDGLGRSRAGFANDDDGRIVLGGVSFYDARGKARRALRERFVAEAERAAPPLSTDGAGEDVWRDAAGRALRTRTQLGIETKHSYEPLSTARWDGAQSDVASPYEHTEDAPPLFVAETVRRQRHRPAATIFAPVRGAPTLDALCRDADDRAGPLQTRTSGDRLVDHREHHSSLSGSVSASATAHRAWAFLRNSLRGLADFDELEAEAACAPMQVVDDPPFVAFLVVLGAGIGVGQAEAERSVEKHGNLAGSRGHGFRLADPAAESSIERAQGGLCLADVDRGEPQQRRGSAARSAGTRAEDAPPRDLGLVSRICG
jgi:hypothetical protein